MTPEQFVQLIQQIQQMNSPPSTFNWLQGVVAVGATIVSVTGVVVGMRSAIGVIGRQLETQGIRLDKLSEVVHQMSLELGILKYAQGITDEDDRRDHRMHGD